MIYPETKELVNHLAKSIGYHTNCGSFAHKNAQIIFRASMHALNDQDLRRAREYALEGLQMLKDDISDDDLLTALSLNQEATA